MAILYTMRAITLICTQLPSGYIHNDLQCMRRLNESERTIHIYIQRFFQQAIKLGYQDNDGNMLCGDLLFSGHTISVVISSLAVIYYFPRGLRYLKYTIQAFCWIGIICMVISRTHYTIDVLLGYWLSVAVFRFANF
ncbi:unnamed protein product [Dracunculus medinensis]|uniref:PAP2_C domain-containing protein n=1 Tax=Dracunculus medinensis TaxID=318479 RepID=A0A0N4U1T4_DRAME|nr:unnamed protein product [Dracunculus medinensis]